MADRMAVASDPQFIALQEFADNDGNDTSALDNIVRDIAVTGQYIYPWQYLKALYTHKLDIVASDFLESAAPEYVGPPLSPGSEKDPKVQLDHLRKELVTLLGKFTCAPFTIQRISELLINPKKHYKSAAKFLRGLEKNILVVSTIGPVTAAERNLKRRLDDSLTEDQNGKLSPTPVKRRGALSSEQQDMDTVCDSRTATDENARDSRIAKTDGRRLTKETNGDELEPGEISSSPEEKASSTEQSSTVGNIQPTSENIQPTSENIQPTSENIEPTVDNIYNRETSADEDAAVATAAVEQMEQAADGEAVAVVEEEIYDVLESNATAEDLPNEELPNEELSNEELSNEELPNQDLVEEKMEVDEGTSSSEKSVEGDSIDAADEAPSAEADV